MKTYFTPLIFVLSSITCLGQSLADKVYLNAKIYTTNNTFVEAMAVKAGKISYIGNTAGIQPFIGASTLVEDLNGKLVLPGFHDVHMHPLEASSPAGGNCVLSNSETNRENFITVLTNCALSTNSNGWKMASGHNISSLIGPGRDPKLVLDDISTTDPILVMEKTSHSVWVNSKALQMGGITNATVDPQGGHIVKNAAGEPNGVLLDNAGDFLIQMALASNTTIDAQNYNGLITNALPNFAKFGITSISEARTYYKRNYISIWNQIKANNLLTVRVGLAPWIYPSDNIATQIAAIQALYSSGDDLLRIRQIKVYSDGILINTTAALHEVYNSSLGFPFTTGLSYVNQSNLSTYITQLEPLGYDFHIHTIGDRGVTEALNAIQAARTTNGNIGARHRLTHLELLKKTDYPRFNSLNVTADLQVAGEFSKPSHWPENIPLLGTARADTLIPVKDLYQAGARITLSSDWDVSELNPFIGIQNALTRNPQEMPNVEEVVKAYTINGAYVMRNETITGSLEVGKYADFLVADKDIFTIPTAQINTTKVLLTSLGGKEIFREKQPCGTDINISSIIQNGVYKANKVTVTNSTFGNGNSTIQGKSAISVGPNTFISSNTLLKIEPCN